MNQRTVVGVVTVMALGIASAACKTEAANEIGADFGAARSSFVARNRGGACRDGQPCNLTCSQSGCVQACAAGGQCNFTCTGGNCSQTCAEGAICNFTCEGGNCKQSCAGGAPCLATCEGGNCS